MALLTILVGVACAFFAENTLAEHEQAEVRVHSLPIGGGVRFSLPMGWEVTILDHDSVENLLRQREITLLSAFSQNRQFVESVTMASCVLGRESATVVVMQTRDRPAMLMALRATIGEVLEVREYGEFHDFFWIDDMGAFLVEANNLQYLYFIIPKEGSRQLPDDFFGSFAIDMIPQGSRAGR